MENESRRLTSCHNFVIKSPLLLPKSSKVLKPSCPYQFSALCSPQYYLQVRAVLVLWFRWLCPSGFWEFDKAAGRKGDDCGITEDVKQAGWTGQLSLLTHCHHLADVAVVPLEFSLNHPVERNVRKASASLQHLQHYLHHISYTNLSLMLLKLFPMIFIRGRHCGLQFFHRRLLYRAFPQCIR